MIAANGFAVDKIYLPTAATSLAFPTPYEAPYEIILLTIGVKTTHDDDTRKLKLAAVIKLQAVDTFRLDSDSFGVGAAGVLSI